MTPPSHSGARLAAAAALFSGILSANAALPLPPPLPFPLPSQTVRIRQTTTLFSPLHYLHLASLDRPLADFEIDDLSASLRRLGWSPRLVGGATQSDALRSLRDLAPSPDLRAPFDSALLLLESGAKSWSLDPVQLVYSPGENASLGISFPLPAASVPARPGTFAADLPLPLYDAVFSQAAIQADDFQITRTESWLSHSPPELFFSQAEPFLVAAGWTPPSPPNLPPSNPQNVAARAQVLSVENMFKNAFRVYHRGSSQLSMLRLPADPSIPNAPPHSYSIVSRTVLQWHAQSP